MAYRKILTDPATSRLIDKPGLNNALDWAIASDWAIRKSSNETCALRIGNGEPLLTGCAHCRKKYLAVLLLERGADVNYQSRDGETLLSIALRHGERDFAALLLDRGADVNYQSRDGTAYSRLLRAAINNNDDEALMTLLYQGGADL